MNILKILIESIKIYSSNKLFWILGLAMALLTFVSDFDVPMVNEGLRCLFLPVQLILIIVIGLIGTSLSIITFNDVQNKKAPLPEIWKEAKSKFFFRLIGAGFLYLLIILVFIILYLVKSRLFGSTLVFSLLSITFFALVTSQGSMIGLAIIIDDFEVGKAISKGLFLSIRFFFFVFPIAILFMLVNIGLTFIFINIYDSLGILDQLVITDSQFFNSYLQFTTFTPVRIFTIFTSTFITPLQSIAFTLAYLKITPRIVKPEIISPSELTGGIDPIKN